MSFEAGRLWPAWTWIANKTYDASLQRMEMAREFSEIWTTGDPSPADRILAEDVSSSDVIYNSSGTQGRENWKQMIHGVFKVPALPNISLHPHAT